jgi:hypothetical protein
MQFRIFHKCKFSTTFLIPSLDKGVRRKVLENRFKFFFLNLFLFLIQMPDRSVSAAPAGERLVLERVRGSHPTHGPGTTRLDQKPMGHHG